MKLSKLIYLVVKNVKYLEDTGFTYEAFKNRDYDEDPDYTNSINNAITPVNEAIHRLSDRDKIAFKIYNVGCPDNNGFIDITGLDIRIKKIKAVFYKDGNRYTSVNFREIDKNRIWVNNTLRVNHIIQYVEDIKSFELNNIYEENTDVELLDYGISETACSYIIEYAQGRLEEQIAPELANMHVIRAEQYFADLEDQQTMFSKTGVKRVYKIQ